MTITLPLKPESVRQQIKRSLRLYRICLPHVFFLAFVLSFILFIPNLITLAQGRDIFAALPLFSPYKLWLVIIDIVCLLIFAAILWRVRCFMLDRHETFIEDLRVASKRLPSILIAALMQTILILLITFLTFALANYIMPPPQEIIANPNHLVDQSMTGLIFFIQIVLVMYVFFSFYFYLPLIVLEDKGILSSLITSAELVWKNWWETIRVQLTPWVVYCFALIGVKAALSHYSIVLPHNAQGSYWIMLIDLLSFAIFIPWVACALVVQMHDLELRKSLSN